MRACREVSPFLFSSDILRTEYGEHHDDDEYREDDSHFTNMVHVKQVPGTCFKKKKERKRKKSLEDKRIWAIFAQRNKQKNEQ